MMGSSKKSGHPSDLETPQLLINVKDFLCADTVVTNEQFGNFVQETGYKTTAEKKGFSLVFKLLTDDSKNYFEIPETNWWLRINGANWRNPEGPKSSIEYRKDYPVTHVSRDDAIAYCYWSNTRLLSEAEWEYAARAGSQSEFPWGETLCPVTGWQCNVWQGDFPYNNTLEDGFLGTAPVKTYPPNENHLYQMIGNVWEWCSNPRYMSFDELNRFNGNAMWRAYSGIKEGQFAIRGGSFLCHHSYCRRYHVYSRNGQFGDMTSSNVGFRVAKDIDEEEEAQCKSH